jgi:hypothetical protein
MWAFDNTDEPEKQVDVNFRVRPAEEPHRLTGIRISAGKEYYGLADLYVGFSWDEVMSREGANNIFFYLNGAILERAIEAVKDRAREYRVLSEEALSRIDTWGDVRAVSNMISRKRGRL